MHCQLLYISGRTLIFPVAWTTAALISPSAGSMRLTKLYCLLQSTSSLKFYPCLCKSAYILFLIFQHATAFRPSLLIPKSPFCQATAPMPLPTQFKSKQVLLRKPHETKLASRSRETSRLPFDNPARLQLQRVLTF